MGRKQVKGTRVFKVDDLIKIRDASLANVSELANEAELMLAAQCFTRAAFLALTGLEEHRKAYVVHSWIVSHDMRSGGPLPSTICVSVEKINNLFSHAPKLNKVLVDYRYIEFFGAKLLLKEDADFRALWNYYIKDVRSVIDWSQSAHQRFEESRTLLSAGSSNLQRAIEVLTDMVTNEANPVLTSLHEDLLYVDFRSERLKLPKDAISSEKATGLVGMCLILSKVANKTMPQGLRGHHVNGPRPSIFKMIEED